jgi:hypothetical protein
MPKNQKPQVWAYKPTPPKFTAAEKAKMLAKVKELVSTHSKLAQKVTRIDMRANRIYLYELVEQFKLEGAVYIKPLIDDKYLEFPYARITFLDNKGEKCTADFQRYNDQWMPLYDDTLEECINHIENDDGWF